MAIDDEPDHAAIGMRFYTWELIKRLAGSQMIFTREVDRSPHFIVVAGSTGTLQPPALDDGGMLFIAVRLDNPPKGAAYFEDECHWLEGINMLEFQDDVLRLPEA